MATNVSLMKSTPRCKVFEMTTRCMTYRADSCYM